MCAVQTTAHVVTPVTESKGVNLRAMMAAHYQCVGPRNIENTKSFLGVPGGNTFHNLFYKKIDLFTYKIVK